MLISSIEYYFPSYLLLNYVDFNYFFFQTIVVNKWTFETGLNIRLCIYLSHLYTETIGQLQKLNKLCNPCWKGIFPFYNLKFNTVLLFFPYYHVEFEIIDDFVELHTIIDFKNLNLHQQARGFVTQVVNNMYSCTWDPRLGSIALSSIFALHQQLLEIMIVVTLTHSSSIMNWFQNLLYGRRSSMS